MSKLQLYSSPQRLPYIRADSGIFGDYPDDYSEFEATGFLEANGQARAWRDINFGIDSLTRGAASPDRIDLAGTDIEVLGFDGVNTTEEVSVGLELDHYWAEGSSLRPHLHWYPTTNDAGNVKWQIEYVLIEDGNVVGASTTIAVVQSGGGVAWTARFADFPDIDTTGHGIGTQLHARLFRDPTDGDDDYGADAAIATFGIHIRVDTLGSRQELAK